MTQFPDEELPDQPEEEAALDPCLADATPEEQEEGDRQLREAVEIINAEDDLTEEELSGNGSQQS